MTFVNHSLWLERLRALFGHTGSPAGPTDWERVRQMLYIGVLYQGRDKEARWQKNPQKSIVNVSLVRLRQMEISVTWNNASQSVVHRRWSPVSSLLPVCKEIVPEWASRLALNTLISLSWHFFFIAGLFEEGSSALTYILCEVLIFWRDRIGVPLA